MTTQDSIKGKAIIALQEWCQFLRSKTFRIAGVGVPIVFAAALWFMVFYMPARTTEDVNRWEYFHSELKRYNDFVSDKYAYESSDNRFVYYVDDSSSIQLGETIRHEILRRDIASFLEFVRSNSQSVWKSWFSSGTELDSVNVQFLRTHTSRFDADQFIELYSIKHAPHRSYQLATSDSAFSWFVDGWNQNFRKIGRQIPSMSFEKLVEIIDPDGEWLKSGTIGGYFRISNSDLHQNRLGFFLFNGSSDHSLAMETRTWYEKLANNVLDQQYQNSAENSSDAEGLFQDLSVVLARAPELNINLQPHETRELSSRVYLVVFLLAVLGGGCLLYFDRNLRKRKESNPTRSALIVNGRVYGMTLKVVTIAIIWFVLLFFPLFGLVGSNPRLGEGALGLFFHPRFLIHWWFFFILGVMTIGYCSQIMSVTRTGTTTFAFLVFFFVIAVNAITLPSLDVPVWYSYIPIMGLLIAVGQTSGLPGLPLYLTIVLASVVYFFLIRAFFVFAEKRGRAKGWINLSYEET